jgi:hypothetical protein
MSYCLLSPADALDKKTPHKIMKGTIAHFECGDNCYLTLIDKKGKQYTGLCLIAFCEKFMDTGDNLATYQGKAVKATMGKGKQTDNAGNVMSMMDSFLTLEWIKK